MRLTGYLGQGAVNDVAKNMSLAVELGLGRVWTSELAHDPFLPLAIVARESPRLPIGSCVAIAFARSPWATAQVAWDLAQMSEGRFALGLGTQVRAHIERRFGGRWESPAPYMRDYVGALKAIWAHWTESGPLRYESKFFNLSLTAPPFHAEPGGTPPPIFMGGVNKGMCRVAGEVADGFIVHGFNSPGYIRDRVLPELLRDRDKETLTVVVPVLTGTSSDPAGLDAAREDARRQVGFYASTPAYRTILAAHGLESLGERLSGLARQQRWDDMTASIDDDVLDLYSVCGTPEEVGRQMVARYAGQADELLVMQALDEIDHASWRGIHEGFDAANQSSVM